MPACQQQPHFLSGKTDSRAEGEGGGRVMQAEVWASEGV